MNFEELSNLWKNSAQPSDEMLKINTKLFKEVSMRRISSNLSYIRLSSILEIVINLPFFLFFVGFWVDHFFIFKYALPGFLLVLLSTESLAYAGYKIYVLSQLKAETPILRTQKLLERLKHVERLQINLLYILIPLVSIPFMVVFAKGLAGVDFYPLLGSWLIYYTLGSILIAIIIVYLLKKFPDKNLIDSIAFLEEIKDFEKQD